jgi:hypothetical protein
MFLDGDLVRDNHVEIAYGWLMSWVRIGGSVGSGVYHHIGVITTNTISYLGTLLSRGYHYVITRTPSYADLVFL